jgi:CRP-like cAMP-binding protein
MWAPASDEDVEWLARVAEIRDFDRGDLIFHEGSHPDDVAVVVDGHARSVHNAEGRLIVVDTIWPGEVIGAVSALSNLAFETDVEAVEPTTMALFPVTMLEDLIKSNSGVALGVIKELAERVTSAVRLSKRHSVDVITRVAQYIAGLTRTHLGGPAYAVEIPIPRVELAAILGTTPETLSRAFNQLRQEGLIEGQDRIIIVPDGETLLARHEGDGSPKPLASSVRRA